VSTADMYREARPEMAALLPAGATRVLDVGCSSGEFGRHLRQVRRLDALVGIEPSERSIEAADVYDQVVRGHFPVGGSELAGQHFDAIFFNDVLEHMVEPVEALDAARAMLRPEGVLIASIPNIRHVSVTGPLVLRGSFRYREAGILDRTHLRFFTRRSIEQLFTLASYEVLRIEPINVKLRPGDSGLRGWLRILNTSTGGRLTDHLAVQFTVLARLAT